MKVWMVVIGLGVALLWWRSGDRLPGELLSEYRQGEVGLQRMAGGRCDQERCLTIVVAPWCGSCQQLDPMIIALRAEVEAQGVPVTLVVGMDKLDALKRYADHYERPVLLDPDRRFTKRAKIRSVPYFAVTDRKGKVVESLRGGYHDVAAMRSALGI